jgi:hypothetical protein
MRANIIMGVVMVSGALALGWSAPAYCDVPFTENEAAPGGFMQENPNLFVPDFSQRPQKGVVLGEVLRIEGEFYVVRDPAGQEVSLQVDNDTKMDIIPKLGDKIEAEVTLQGHAVHITAPKDPNGLRTGLRQ